MQIVAKNVVSSVCKVSISMRDTSKSFQSFTVIAILKNAHAAVFVGSYTKN